MGIGTEVTSVENTGIAPIIHSRTISLINGMPVSHIGEDRNNNFNGQEMIFMQVRDWHVLEYMYGWPILML